MGLLVLSFFVVIIIVCSTLFFLFKRKDSILNPFKNPYYWITSFIAIPIVIAGTIAIWYLVATTYQKKEFHKITWNENKEYRYELVDDLIESNKLIGLTQEEIINLLGEADYNEDLVYGYYIGYSKAYFLNLDPDWLEIEFVNNKANIVRVRP